MEKNIDNTNTENVDKKLIIFVVNGSSFGDLVIVDNTNKKINTCKLCKYNGKNSDKLPCSWCLDYIGRNGYYR